MLVEYSVDRNDCVRSVGAAWFEFACGNKAQNLTSEAVVGRPLWDFIANDQVRHIYQILLDRVRSLRETLVVPFRCDGPDVRRFMELQLTPVTNEGVRLEARLVREERREFIRLLGADPHRSDEFVTICSWCKKVQHDGRWLDLEAAVARQGLFVANELPQLTHGICEQCTQQFKSEFVGQQA
ncbi:MAG: hypothetical protein AAF581_18635 [Planctomycetota bacterium]